MRALLAVALALLTPSLAHADEPAATSASTPVDTIILKSGAQHRGRVTEVVPGDHVTIVDGWGMKVFPWAQVDRIVVTTIEWRPPPGTQSPVPAPVPAPLPAPAAAPTPSPETTPVGPRARVYIDTPKPVVLYRQPAGTTSWVLVCNTPCTADVPIGDLYRVQGNSVRPSKEFRLAAKEGEAVTIVVDPPSTAGEVLGGTAATIGAIVAYVGLTALGNNRAREKGSAGAALGIGAGLTVGGVVLYLLSRTTDIEIAHHPAAAPKDSPKPAAKALVEPSAAWTSARDAIMSEGPVLRGPLAPPRTTVPILFEATF